MKAVPPEYVQARRVLLDALSALDAHLDAVILVGAQAVYLHTGAGDLTVAPTTTDADLVVEPARLADEPKLADALHAANFVPGANPGTWLGSGQVAVDLLVPEALGGSGGRRGARLPVHGNKVARRTYGLEAAIIDAEPIELAALDDDPRKFRIRVAGAGALLVAKSIKIAERIDRPARLRPKDALDVLRLLQATETRPLADRLASLARDPMAGPVTLEAVTALRQHACTRRGVFVGLAADAVGVLDDPDVIAESMIALVEDLLVTYDRIADATHPS